jgi:uncharacterized protein YyaL (SSP411 family)
MTEKVNWTDNLQEALQQAATENKPILLDFFNPH